MPDYLNYLGGNMGRQLVFWKYEDGIYLNNGEVYRAAVAEGKNVTGLAELPVSEILMKVKKVFREYERLDDYNYGGLEGSFTIRVKPQAIVFDCSLRMSDEELGKIADMMKGFGCPPFDPQTGVRADS